MSGERPNHVDHPEDELYDAIDIHIVPRWKESELSGDEWRFSYVALVKRKGETIITISASRLDWLLQRLHFDISAAGERDKFDREAWERTKTLCDQPGCASEATVFYKRLKRYTKFGDELVSHEWDNEYRQFCLQHQHRGDCDLDDADHNYERISNPYPKVVAE